MDQAAFVGTQRQTWFSQAVSARGASPSVHTHRLLDVGVTKANLAGAIDRLDVTAESLRDFFAVEKVYARDNTSLIVG
jgi:hypothetical protein